MKYYVGLILSLLLAIPTGPIEASVITNNMTNSTITQNFYLNCTTEECQPVIQEIVVSETIAPDEVVSDPVETQEPESDSLLEIPSKGIIINEIVSAPVSGEKEWVELYNSLDSSVSLDGWFLEEGAGKKTVLFGEILANGYLVFETNNLNNSGDIIFLKDSTGLIIDQVVYGNWESDSSVENPVSPKAGESLIFWEDKYIVSTEVSPSQPNLFTVIEEESSVIDVETQNIVSSGTEEEIEEEVLEVQEPENEEVLEMNYQYSEEIQINEFLPDPEGSDKAEWIELFNSSGEDLVLEGWTLDDIESGGSSAYSLTGKSIQANGYLVLTQEETGIVLNNSSDQVVLKDPEGKVISQVVYDKTKTDESYVLIENTWQTSDVLTPGEENELPSIVETQNITVSSSEENNNDQASETVEPSDELPLYPSYSLSQIKDLNLRQKVLIQGRVAVLPGVFSKNSIYISDGTSGLQVYFSLADWPEFELGQELMISGSVSQSLEEKRVLVKEKVDIVLIGESQLLESREINSLEIDSSLVGSYISIEGKLIEKENSRLLMADADGEFLVYLKKGASVSSTVYSIDDDLRISGVLVQNKDEFRLQPRFESDIERIDNKEEEVLGVVASNTDILGTASTQRKISVGLAFSVFLLFSLQVGLFLSKKTSKRMIKRPLYRLKEYLQGVKG